MRTTGPMFSILVVTVITVLNHMVFTGARFTLLLFAIQLGASPTMVGLCQRRAFSGCRARDLRLV